VCVQVNLTASKFIAISIFMKRKGKKAYSP
jgi:hypothetical protein